MQRDLAHTLMKKVTASDYLSYLTAEIESASARIRKADTLFEAGEHAAAEREYRRATGSLNEVVRRGEAVVSWFRRAKASCEAAEAARANADAVLARDLAPDQYRQADAAFRDANEILDTKELGAPSKAARRFRDAADLFELAHDYARESSMECELASRERASMLLVKEKATERRAAEAAITEWQNAARAERQAEADFARRDYRRAQQGFRDAADHYVAAIERLLQKAQIDKMVRRDRPPLESSTAPNETRLPSVTEPTEPPGPDPKRILPPPKAVVDCFDDEFDSSLYAVDLSEEDEAFLLENLDRLTRVGVSGYDPATGLIVLDYPSGREARQGIDTLATPRAHIEWESAETRGLANPPPGSSFSIGGNTRGLVLFPVPFRHCVRITFAMNTLMMSRGERFGALIHVDPGNKSHYLTDFLDIGRSRGGRERWQRAEGRGRPDSWVDKTRHVPWMIEYRMPDPVGARAGEAHGNLPASARLTVTYDVGGEYEATHSAKLPELPSRGRVGLHWTKVKFRLWNLRVCGILDKEKAVEMLREKPARERGERSERSIAQEDVAARGTIAHWSPLRNTGPHPAPQS